MTHVKGALGKTGAPFFYKKMSLISFCEIRDNLILHLLKNYHRIRSAALTKASSASMLFFAITVNITAIKGKHEANAI